MKLAVAGLSHRTAPVELREHIAPTSDELAALSAGLRAAVPQSAVLFTCNRAEVYAVLSAESDAGVLVSILADMHRMPREAVASSLYVHEGEEAVRHLFRVAAGLESLILGEAEVLGQVARAQRRARVDGALGRGLDHLFTHAVRVGRQARRKTGIGRNSSSVSSAAVRVALDTFGSLQERRVLVVGAGEAARLASRALKGAGAAEIRVVNRTLAHAQALAEEVGGRAYPLEHLAEALAGTAVVIAASGGPGFSIGRSLLETMAPRGAMGGLLVLDVAVPRNVDPSVRELPDVLLYDIDDLQEACDAAWRERRQEVPKVERIVAAEATAFMAWWREQEVTPLIATLYQEAEALRRRELDEALQRMGPLSPEAQQHLEGFSRSLLQKLLHGPITALKQGADDPAFLRAAAQLLSPPSRGPGDDR